MAKSDTCIILWKIADAPSEYRNLLSADNDYILWVEETFNDTGILMSILNGFGEEAEIENWRLDDGNWLYGVYFFI